jgi:hypothetical protein
MDLKETGSKIGDWNRVAQDIIQWEALMNAVMNIWIY